MQWKHGRIIFLETKKTPAQKIRDYFRRPKWAALTKKQEKQYVEYKST